MDHRTAAIRKQFQKQHQNQFISNVLGQNDSMALVPVEDPEEDISEEELEDFRNTVKQWMDLDTQVKRLKIAIRERKLLQDVLNEKISDFMSKRKIDNLNTKDGIIQFKSKAVKAPLSAKKIRDQLYMKLDSSQHSLLNDIFNDRKEVQKQSLRRIM